MKPGELDERIDAAGGFASSVTTADHISVFEQVPAGALELALWLEAERMAGLADGIRDSELAKAKDAIAGEYRAAYQTSRTRSSNGPSAKRCGTAMPTHTTRWAMAGRWPMQLLDRSARS